MVSRTALRVSLVAALLVAGRSASAEPITFTGNVSTDFNPQTTPGVAIVTDSLHDTDAQHVAQPSWMTSAGLTSGFNIKDVALYYNAQTDTMYVGVQTYGVADSVDGTNPGSTDTLLASHGISNPAGMGDGKGMAVAFAPLTGTYNALSLPAPVIVAGVSSVTSQRGTGLDGFTVTNYAGGTSPGTIDLLSGFGQTLPSGMGSLAFDPSSAHPGFEFTITNFSKLLGANPENGLVVMTQDGSVYTTPVGNDQLVGAVPEAQFIPEPTTWMIWTGLAAGGLAWRARRVRRPRS
jgi:hypothetical protein